ncbi:hypothetical protein CLU79DRAFT_804699 [Phycomyces nitens]|nr:hypothetical protein CLU79DRAFT_804699 [Phycomyces nitens]
MSFGADLKNHVPAIIEHVGEGIQSLNQMRNFVRDRSHIEREYAQKLENLAKKYKPASKSRSGESAADDNDWNDSASTCLAAWTTLVSQTEQISKSRFQLVDCINNTIIESIKAIISRKEDARKKDKAKQAYDESCVEIENIRAKIDKGTGDQDKYQKQLDAAILECGNRKNLYILAIGVANAERAKYFEEDMPKLSDHYNTVLGASRKIDPAVDSSEFIRSAIGTGDPGETAANVRFSFIPWNGGSNAAEAIVDRDSNLTTGDSDIIFLNNRLIKDRKQLDTITNELSRRSGEADDLKSKLLMESLRNITLQTTQMVKIKSEIEVIIQNIGDEGLTTTGHDFKSCSFTIPTTCDFCNNTIWGLSKQGFTCRACGFNCHAKCEMKIAPNCSLVRGKIDRQPSFVKSQSSLVQSKQQTKDKARNLSFGSSMAANSPNIPVHAAPSLQTSPSSSLSTVRALYSYDSQFPDELSIVEGETLSIIGSKVVALYDFTGVDDKELNLKQGDMIQVINKDENGWWEGVLNQKTGIFPANYVGPN